MFKHLLTSDELRSLNTGRAANLHLPIYKQARHVWNNAGFGGCVYQGKSQRGRRSRAIAVSSLVPIQGVYCGRELQYRGAVAL